MIEQRLTFRLIRYWNQVRKDKKFPQIEKFNASAIEDIWPACFRVAVDQRAGLKFIYEYTGELLIKVYGRDLTGETVVHRPGHFPGSLIYSNLGETVERAVPCEATGHMVSPNGKLYKYRACFLPFGKNEKKITHIIAGLSFRQF